MSKYTLIESDRVNGAYNMAVDSMIVEDETGRRILLVEGFGGLDTPIGGAYRWIHGAAAEVLPSDTLTSLRQMDDCGYCAMSAAINGYDPARPMLNWSGYVIDGVARNAVEQR